MLSGEICFQFWLIISKLIIFSHGICHHSNQCSHKYIRILFTHILIIPLIRYFSEYTIKTWICSILAHLGSIYLFEIPLFPIFSFYFLYTLLNDIYLLQQSVQYLNIRIVMDQLANIINVQHVKIGFSLILAALSYIKISQMKDQRTNIKKQSELSVKNKNKEQDKLGRDRVNKKEQYIDSKMEQEYDRQKHTSFEYSNGSKLNQKGQNKTNLGNEEKGELIDLRSYIKGIYKQKMQSIKDPIFPNQNKIGPKIKRTRDTEYRQEQNRGYNMVNQNKRAQQNQQSQQFGLFRVFNRHTSNPIQENKNMMYCQTPKYQRTINPNQNINNGNINDEQTIKNKYVYYFEENGMQFPNLNLSIEQSSSQQNQSKNKRISKLKSKQHKLTKNTHTSSHRALLHRNNRIGLQRKLGDPHSSTIKTLNKKNPNIKSTGNLFTNQGYFQN